MISKALGHRYLHPYQLNYQYFVRLSLSGNSLVRARAGEYSLLLSKLDINRHSLLDLPVTNT